MEKVRVTIPIKVKAKDGEKGEKGDTGATGKVGITWRTSEWQAGTQYRNDEDLSDAEIAANGNARYVDIVVVPNEGRTAVSKAYKCIQTHTSTDTTAPGATGASGYWNEVSNLQGGLITPFILTSAAWIENLTVGGIKMYDTEGNTIFNVSKDDDGNVAIECNQGNFNNIVVNDGTFTGTLNGVTGSFKSLQCLDDDGNAQGKLLFSSSGDEASFYMDFDTSTFNGDIFQQGSKDSRNLRFYAQDIYCRRSFGARMRNVLVIDSTYGYFFLKGMDKNEGTYVSLAASTTSAGDTYYTIPCYGTEGDYSGFPVDTIMFSISGSTTYRYNLSMAASQRVLLVNANDRYNNVLFYSNGSTVQLDGGSVREVVKVRSDLLLPTVESTVLGAGLLCGAVYDNNW